MSEENRDSQSKRNPLHFFTQTIAGAHLSKTVPLILAAYFTLAVLLGETSIAMGWAERNQLSPEASFQLAVTLNLVILWCGVWMTYWCVSAVCVRVCQITKGGEDREGGGECGGSGAGAGREEKGERGRGGEGSKSGSS